MLLLLVLVSALGAARADCNACIQGLCHSKKVLIEGFPITDQLAIDRTDNILYVQLDYRTTAIYLDEPKMRAVHAENTTGLAVDQETQVLYSSLDGIIHAYRYQQGGYTKDEAFKLDRPTTPTKLRYEDTLYTINEDGSTAYFSKISKTFTGYDNLENFVVTDMANVRDITNWFFVSGNKLYKYSCEGRMTWQLISYNKQVLSIGKHGDVYFGDASDKIIYKLDRETRELFKYASYVDGSVDDFVFDKNENIVFVDADGIVARWVPSGEECVAPHRIGSHRAEWHRSEESLEDNSNKGTFVVDLDQSTAYPYYTYYAPIDSNESHESSVEAEVVYSNHS